MVFRQLSTSCNHILAKITDVDKDFARKLDFKDKIFAIKIRDIYKMKKKKRIVERLVFWL